MRLGADVDADLAARFMRLSRLERSGARIRPWGVTYNVACPTFEEADKGRPGKRADLEVLLDDHLAVTQEKIPSIKAALAMVSGCIAYAAQAFRTEVNSARVVSAGRTLGSAEKFQDAIEAPADKLKAGTYPTALRWTRDMCPNPSRWAKPARSWPRRYTSPSAPSAPLRHLGGMKTPRSSWPSTRTPTLQPSAWPNSDSSAICSRSCQS